MPNLVLNNSCNLGCRFCFASEYRGGSDDTERSQMGVDEFARLIAFAGSDTVRLCGGEPTLHPEFVTLLDLALQAGQRSVFLMTNGLWPVAVLRHIDALERSAKKRIQYLVNVLPPQQYGVGQRVQLDATLQSLRRQAVTLGVTLDDPEFDPGWLHELARRHQVGQLRFSVAAPTVTDPRSWTEDPEAQLRELARVVHRLITSSLRSGFKLQSDCGYVPPCMFEPEALAELRALQGPDLDLGFDCQGPVDIGPGGEAWRCYGLYSTLRAQVADFEHAGELGEHFERQIDGQPSRQLLDACEDCAERRVGTCGGGCHATRAVLQLQARAREAGVRLDDAGLLSAVPSRVSAQLRSGSQDGAACWLLLDHQVWTALKLADDEKRLLDGCDDQHSVAEILRNMDCSSGQRTRMLRLLRRLFEQQAIALRPPAD